MTDFTTLVNRGKRKYANKYLKKRQFGKCEGCQNRCLLIEYDDPKDPDARWSLCDYCYDELAKDEK